MTDLFKAKLVSYDHNMSAWNMRTISLLLRNLL